MKFMITRTILTDREWEEIKEVIPDNKRKKGHPARDHRQVLEAILWVLRTGAPWRDVPKEFCPWTTAYTRFRRWTIQGVWLSI
jgi:transposase